MKKINVFHYDKMSDRLFISSKKEDEIIEGSVRLLNLIVDITRENRVANIELLDVSEYLRSLDIEPRILNTLKEAEFAFRSVRNGYLISIVLKSGKEIVRVPYNIYLSSTKQVVIKAQ